MQLEHAAASCLEQYCLDGRTFGIVVAVSGGADSMALLDVLQTLQKQYAFSLLAAHVHHGLRGEEADRDARFVAEVCQKRGIPLETLHTDVAALAAPGESIEQAGRRVRYAFFEELRVKNDYRFIATAHHADDNLETVLLHLTRGSGLRGLCGIAPCHNGIIRPFLTCTRASIEQYCEERAISFVTDGTNTDILYSRNRIRHTVLPQLKEINPQVVTACTRMTAVLREEESFLNALTEELVQSARVGEDTYDRAVLAQAHAVLRRRALKLLMEQAGSDCEEKHVLLTERAVEEGSGAVQVPGGVYVSVTENALKLERRTEETPYFEYPLVVGQVVRIGDTLYLPQCVSADEYQKKSNVHKKVLQYSCDYDKLKGDVIIRQRCAGDAFHPVGGVGKTLKKFFNEKQVSLHLRSQTPVVCDTDGIVLVAGFSCDDRVKLDADTKRVFILYPMFKEEKSCAYT